MAIGGSPSHLPKAHPAIVPTARPETSWQRCHRKTRGPRRHQPWGPRRHRRRPPSATSSDTSCWRTAGPSQAPPARPQDRRVVLMPRPLAW